MLRTVLFHVFLSRSSNTQELASRFRPPWANSAVHKIGTGTQITPKLHSVLIIHALILQTPTHIPPANSPVDLNRSTHSRIRHMHFVSRTEVFYCTSRGMLHGEGLVHTSLDGDWKIMLCLYSFGIQPALFGKKKLKKIKKGKKNTKRRKPKSAKANCQMAHHTYLSFI